MEEIWLPLLGLAAGVIGSMVGLGGGFVVVPVLTFMGFSPTAAASSSLFAAFSSASAATASYARQKRIDYRTGLTLGLLALPGTVLGALFSAAATPDIFRLFFGIVLVGSAAYLLLSSRIGEGQRRSHLTVLLLSIAASFFAGIISSFFGIGGGLVFVPLMVAIMGMSMWRAAPTAQLVLMFVAFTGMVTHTLLGHPDFYHALLLSSGAFVGGLLGAKLSLNLRERGLRILAAVVILVVAAKLFWDAVAG
ncbi:permease [Cenarchaeum symbiosum A]|uniref:Probable membrane transporter protein n=1 Tax=Cenarchaeum symbiosum (strain A) TaxID=414004 RepID=A0RWV5_CENSY|nr:permease [Cenarchaeum symbiosum A]